MGNAVRVVIATTSAILAAGLTTVLERGGVDVAAVTTDLGDLDELTGTHRAAAALIVRPRTEFASLDVLPDAVPVLVVGDHHDAAYVARRRAHGGGHVAFAAFDNPPHALVDAVRAVAKHVKHGHTTFLLDGVRVTARERDVAALVAEGMTNAQIARRLGVAQQTVKNHLSMVMAKIGAESRLQLCRWAVEHHVTVHGVHDDHRATG